MKIFEPKLLTCFKGYQKKDLVSDIVAGIIVAIIALPLSIALAIASGVDPEQGLYTAIFAGFVIAMFGGSKVNISGPTAAFATIVAGIVADKGMEGLFLATIMAGVILIIMGACKLGTLIKYIPKTITVGFTAGIAVTILIGQIKDFLGLTFPENAHNIETIDKIKNIFNYIGTMDRWEPVAVGVGALVIMIVWSKFIKKIPSSLIVVLIGALAIGLPKVAVATIGDAYPIGSAIPKFIVPSFDGKLILSLLPDAFTIALLAGIESLLSCVVSDNMINDKHNPNTELIAQGLGNICSGFMGGIPETGAIARTSANVKNGGKTPLAGMIHAVVLLVVLLLLIPYASLIPMPVIAAILFIVAYNMSEWRVFVKICKTKQVIDIIILCLTFVLTVAFNLVIAIAVGLVLHYAIFFAIKLANKNKEVKAE
ncbi:MAG: sodium-independent anion transporter [Clostridia bacterium]|nr:sodium-independent anion transporter [Clostridia bacterium]